jgi:hypothetical protein
MAGVNLVEPKQQKAVLLHVAGEAVRDMLLSKIGLRILEITMK